jgi:hypothetical protein
MKNGKDTAGKKRVWVYAGEELYELLENRARDEHATKADIISKALTMYLTKDITDESLLIAKMSEIIRVVGNLATRLEVSQKLDLEWQHYTLMFTPELPNDETERNLVQERAAKRAGDFLLAFRRRMKMTPKFLETIFGVMLEEDDTDPREGGR